VGPRELKPPRGAEAGKARIYGTSTGARGWERLCRSKPAAMKRYYAELTGNPFPPSPTPRHHRLKGKLRNFWEYEVSGGDRVRHKRGPGGELVVVYAGSHPSDTR